MPYTKKKSKFSSSSLVDSSFVNFLATFAGFLCSSIILLILIGQFFGTKTNPQPIKETAGRDKNTGESEIAVSSAYDLTASLIQMPTIIENSPLPVRVENLRLRIRIADQLLLLESTDSQQELAILTKIDSLANLIDLAEKNQLTYSDEAQKLKEICENHRLDLNRNVRTRAQLTRFRLNGVATAKDPQASSDGIKPLVEDSRSLLEQEMTDFEGDHFLKSMTTISDINKQFYQSLESAILENQPAKNPTAVFRELRDKAQLTEYGQADNLDGTLHDTPESRQKAIGAAKKWSEDSQGGEYILAELNFILEWLEQIQEFDVARESYQMLIDSAPYRATPELTQVARQMGMDGIRRCDLLGNSFDFRGIMVNQQDWKPDDLVDEWVVLLFLTSKNSNYQFVLKTARIQELMDQGVKVLVVDVATEQIPPPEEWSDACFVRKDSLLKISEQYPVSMLPRAMLINPKAKVQRISIVPRELYSKVMEAKQAALSAEAVEEQEKK